ncbi:hypothetical protein BJ138DRAFT_1150704 [Hygrophoropsis aurantiaca]|uniref:Uncharacterized protein n=1 Tax=Hygrophoropsis aurantiaca TaxID=72124 RepID=A0ACB8AFT5_9AGAM|nr:hypothetical protein BJ138DRAFT_1150704 [Hygrophoropsis aurantiaca]
MLGVDHRWLRLHIAYEFEDYKHTRHAGSRILGFSRAEQQKANRQFLPGEVAHVDGRGGVHAALFDFMVMDGFKLTYKEQNLKRSIDRRRHHVSKYCLVLERLSATEYVVCYLASFGRAVHPDNMSPIARFFSVAMGDSPEWPLGCRPLHMIPRWKGYGFVFGVPVVRSNLEKTWHGRFTAGFGELERLKIVIERNLGIFGENRHQLIADELEWIRADRPSEKWDIITRPRMASAGQVMDQARIATEDTVTALSGADSNAESESWPDALQACPGGASPQVEPEDNFARRPLLRRPPIRLLEIPSSQNNLQWILKHLRQDIMDSSLYFNRPHTNIKPNQTLLRRIPRPLKILARRC